MSARWVRYEQPWRGGEAVMMTGDLVRDDDGFMGLQEKNCV